MEIRDAKGNILIDSVVTQNAEHVEELMQTDHVSLQWVSNVKSVLPAGSYVVPFGDGVRYILLDPYTPDQNNTDEFTYSPQFKHPKMYLGRVPYTRATTDEDGNAATLLVWDYKGYLSNLLADICSFAGVALKNAGLITTETLSYSILGDITGNVSLSISNNDVLSVLNALASNLNCEWHIDWEQMRLYFGNVSFDKNEGSRLVLTSGGNVGMASVSSQKDTYYNVYRPQGSARNMAGVSDSGSYYATNRRLELDKDAFPDGLIYTDGKGKVISKASFEQTKLPMLAQTLFFDEIYPKLNLYAYDIRYRERYLLDDNGDKVETYAGSGKYKRYAIWYMRLAFPVRNSDGSVSSWKDAVLGDTFRLIDGYTLMCAFGANPSSSLTSPLAGREFELRYVETEADAKSLSAEADEKSGDTGVTVKAGDFEIIYNTEGDLIIPTTPSQGLVPKGEATPSENGNIITLFNIVLGSDFLKAAQTDLANAAKREIARQFSDLNQYTFSSDPVSFKDDMPGLYIGRSVTYKDGVGNTLDTRIMRLTTKLDFPFMVEITVGNKVLKGTTSQLKEDVELILSGNRQAASAGGVTESVVRSLIRGYCNNTYLSKKSDDVAKGIITLLKGSYWGKFNEESGAAMTVNPENGQSFLEVDRLKVRLKAFFEQLEIQKVSYVGGKLVLSKGQGVTIVDVEEVTTLNGAAYRCYFLGEQEGVKIDNKLAVGDQMICKDFNISEGESDGATNKYYWRLVTAVSSETVKRGNNVCHWVDLSVSDCDTGSDVPSAGDTICHLGNRSDTDRQGAEILSVVDVNSPSFSIYAGIDGYTLTDKEYVTMGVAGGKAYFKVYGDMYVGDRTTGDAEPNSYLRWKMGDDGKKGKLTIKGEISIKSTLSGYKNEEGEAVEITLEDKLKQTNDNVMKIIEGFRNQIDGAIETWFFDKDEPELTDEPAINWKADDDETEENKDKDTYSVHVGDLYYSKNGKAYRFQKNGDNYVWQIITDTDITKALQEAKKANDAANAAQGTADSKMKVFVVQPTDNDEYSVGDMWVNATYPADGSTYNNEILHCVTKKAVGEAFSISHWAQSSNIKTQFNNFVNNTYAEDKKDFYSQLDGKVETWYQPDDPKNKWAAADYSKHTGDIWYNDYTNVASRWTGTAWVELKDQAAIDAKALAESKRRVFTTTTLPTPPYDAKDLWVQGENGDIMVCVTPKAAGETASASDWAKASKYTDDSALNTFINEYNAQIADFSHQLDGKIETWYYDYAPEPGNKPASDWTTDELKASHSGDLFYNIGTGVAYRWTGEAWEILKDKEVQTALDNAEKAQDTADKKRRVFISQPTVPYDAGDLWVSDTDNGKVTKVCVNSKTTGTFSTEDWKESDDAALNKFSSSIMENIKGIKSQLDKKAETWYQADDPSNAEGWVNSEHKGDLWYNTTNDTTWYFNGTEWVQQNIPTDVFDKIDGKAAIYVSKPDTYHKNDLWFLDTDYTLNGVAYKKGTILVANATSNDFSEQHWDKLDRYTDDSSLTDFINGQYNTFVINIKSQVDKKAETWYQEADPSSSWKENEKAQHVGDLWWKPSDNLTYCYYLDTDKNTYGWKRQDVPQEVFDRIDGKAEIFVAKPTSGYHERDMWILEADYTFTVSGVSTKYKAGTIVIATATWAGPWQDSPCNTHWKKFDSYTDSETVAALQTEIANVAKEVNEFNNSISDLEKATTEAIRDGVIDGTERKSIEDALLSAERECMDVIESYRLTTANAAYNTYVDADTKNTLASAYSAFVGDSKIVTNENISSVTYANGGAYGELVGKIKELLAAEKIDTDSAAVINNLIKNFNTKYKDFIAALNTARNLIDFGVSEEFSALTKELGSYSFLKDALEGFTDIKGGLILSSAIALGQKAVSSEGSGSDNFVVHSGVSGLYEKDSLGNGIAFWAGGSRIDKEVSNVENAATFLIRHDGTGYAAGGAIKFNADGTIDADPMSFFVGEASVGNVLGLFQFVDANKDGKIDFSETSSDFAIPKLMFDHLNVGGTGIKIGSKRIYIKDGVMFLEGDLAVTGGITMYASNGIVSGIKEQMLGVLDPSQFGERNGYISIIGEIGGGTVKGIKVNGKTYNTVDSEGLVTIPDYPTSLDWARIENKPTTLIQYGITDAKISDGVITLGNNTITPLTAHQSIYALTIIGIGENTFSYTPNSAAAVLALTPAWIGAPATDGTGASGTWGISVSGNAATANKLKNAVSVWGQSFDGSADITGNMKNVGSITPTGETLRIVGNLIVTGGITMYATDGTFDSAFGQQLANFVDNVTIKFVNDKLVAVNNGNVTSIIISGTEYKPTDGAVTLPDLFAPSAHKHAIADVNGLQDILSKKLDASLKGVANGLATLDSSGKVPSAQLPSYVDDVLEYTNKASFPTTGESGKIYIDQTTNLTYRWGGTAYVEISQSLALGETSSTAYAGDKGKQNATDIAALKTGKADKATTLAGYGITNAYTKDETDGKYLALAGGTMTGVISSTFASNTWINGVTNAIITASYTGYGAVLSMPVYGGRVSISSYPGSENDNHIYFTYATAEQIAAGDNSVPMVRMSWDAATNTLAAAVFQGALSGNASSATKLLNAKTLWGQSFDGSANVSGAITGASDITMSGALKLNGITISKTSNGLLKIDGDLIVTGGITMYASDGVKSGLMEQILVDGVTIGKNSDGALYAINTGNVRTIKMGTVEYTPNDSGVVELPAKVTWDNIDGKPSTFTPSAHTHTFASLTDKPTTISGYGITDAKIVNGVITLGTATITPLTAHQTIKLESGKNNGTLKLTVGGTATDNIAVKGLGSAAYTASSAYAAASHTHSQYLVASSLDGYVNALMDNTSTNVFVTAISKSGKTLSYTKSFTKKSLSAQSHSGWKGDGSDELTIPDMSVIKYWNGAYDANKNSHLAYCIMGAFGDMATASKSSYYTKTEVNTKLTDGSVTKLGSANVGSDTQHFYLNGGTATASTSTVGGTARPMYLKAGVMTAISDTVGGTAKPVFLNAGTLTAISATVGSASKPVYLNGGSVTACGYDFTSYLPLAGGTMDAGARISHADGNLYLGRSDNNGWVMCQDMCSQTAAGDSYWSLRYDGTFHSKVAVVSGNTSVGSLTINGINVTKSSDGILKIDGNLIVTGGITMYATDGVASGLMEQILVDGTTIGKKADGTLYAINTGNVRSIIMGSTTYTPNSNGAVTLPEKVTWANIEGKPSTFTPSAHTHAISEITNLQATLDGKAVASHTHAYLPLSGGALTGSVSLKETCNILLRPSNPKYTSGIGYDTSGNECVAIWANATVTRLRWHAGVDMSTLSPGTMMGITPDFEISKASGNAVGYIAGNAIIHSGNYTSYASPKAHTHSVTINGSTKTIAATGGTAVDLGTYLTAHQTIYGLTIQANGTSLGTYTPNSAAKTFNITYENVGAAAASHTHSYLPLAGGTMSGSIFFPNSAPITYTTNSSSNWIYILRLFTGSSASETSYQASIGWHNTGGSGSGNGALTLVPYAQNVAPWGGTVGLYIAQSELKFNGTDISLSGHTHNYAGSLSAGGAAISSISSNCLRYTGTGTDALTAYQTPKSYMGSDASWASYIICNQGDGSSYFNQTIRMPFWGVPQYQRLEGGTFTGWNTFITSENIGSQSVSNSDMVDGYHASAFALSGHTHSYLYTEQVAEEQNTDACTWIREYVMSRKRGHVYNSAGMEWQYLYGISTGGRYGNIIRSTYGNGVPAIQIMGLSEGSWSSWVNVLTEKNYNSYSPTLTGGGASGTWAIAITGNAATATNADMVDGIHASSLVVDKGSAYSGLIYDLPSKSVFSGYNLSDAPVQSDWVSGIVFGSNWNNSHYQHYLVEAGSRWYATRESSNGKMVNWNTFAYLTDTVANSDTCDGLHVHTGRNNEANKIVRTDGWGYIQCGYINSSSGDEGNNSSPARVWGTNGSDSYMRTYLTSALNVNTSGRVRSESGNKISGLQYYSGNGTFIKDGTDVGGAWSVPSDSNDAQFNNGQAIRMWFNSTYYTDILSAPNPWGAASGLYIRQIANDAIPAGTFKGGWRLLLDSSNYNRYAPSLTGTGASGTWGISISGNAATATKAVTSSFLDSVSRMEYGWNGLNYFNASLTAGCTAKANDAPTSDWWHILRFNQSDSRGYYTDLAIPLNHNSLYWKCVRYGSLAVTSWVKVLDSLNYNEYAPTKTGTGASGTWGISISGNAATATALTSSAGSSTTPVYFSGGKPAVCGSSLAVSITGNAATATKWATARTITLSGSVTGSVSIDGSGNVTLETTTNHTHSYLPLAGGTMDKNARIAQASGSLYIGSSTNTGYVYLQDMASQKGTSYWNITQTGVAVFYNSVTSTVFYGALEGNATTATTASKLGSSTVGSGTQHFYLSSGTATASTSTVGGTAKPMYLSAGTMTAISATVGSASNPVYLNAGTITACSSSLTDYLPLAGGQMTGDLYVQRTSDAASIWARYYDKTSIRMVAASSAVFIQCGNYAFTNNVPMYLSGPSGNDGSTLYLKFSSVVASGGITMYSDVRKKNILSDELLSVKSIADAPLFAFNYKSDKERRMHTGTSAQYWHGAYGDMFGYKDDEGYYTLEYQNLGVAMGISLAREIVKYESKTDKKIRLMKKKINDLEARIKELEGSREERRTA